MVRMDLEWILGEMMEHWSGIDLQWISFLEMTGEWSVNGFGMDFRGNDWGAWGMVGNGFGMDLEWILGEMTGEHGEWSGMDLEWISNGF